MFRFVNRRQRQQDVRRSAAIARAGFGLEAIEGRQLLSGSMMGGFHHRGGGPGHGGGMGAPGGQVAAIQFDQTPTAVQTGLDTLAENAGLSDPASTATVQLQNANGVETYSVTIKATGTMTRLTVDAAGEAVMPPTLSTSDFGTLSGSGDGSNAAASAEISAIATALGLTVPASTDTVRVVTASDGSVTYSVTLQPASASSGLGPRAPRGMTITVDSDGNPVADQVLPFGVMPTAIQDGLNANAPSDATALASDSTQPVRVQTVDGVTLYTTMFTTSGTRTTVTVNAAGTLTSMPNTSSTTYGSLSAAVQAELQAMASAAGSTATLADDQSVTVLTEANGATIYSVSVDVTQTAGSRTFTRPLMVSSDADGNPTVTPARDLGGAGGPGMVCGGGLGVTDGTPSSTSTTSTSSSSKAAKAAKKMARATRRAARRAARLAARKLKAMA